MSEGINRVSRPVLGHASGVHLGGIGTGSIEVCRDGTIGVVNLVHSPQCLLAGFAGSFLALRAGPVFRLLQKPGRFGARGVDGLMTSVQHPVGRFECAIADVPLRIVLTVFSPLVPHDLPRSTTPAAVFVLRLRNTGNEAIDIDASFSWENVLGICGLGSRGEELSCDRGGATIAPFSAQGIQGLLNRISPQTGERRNAWGQTALTVAPPAGWTTVCWSFWNVLDDGPGLMGALAAGRFEERYDAGPLDERVEKIAGRSARKGSWDDPDPRFGGGREGREGLVHPAGVLAARGVLAPDAAVEIPFVLGWHTPHCVTSDGGADAGRFCATHHPDAIAVAADMHRRWRKDLEDTRALSRHVTRGDLPEWLADKLLNDTTALTTNAVIPADGTLYTLEGSPSMRGALGTMDQRLVSHPGTSLFQVAINRSEIRHFADLQDKSGSIPHFNGNARCSLGSSSVEYGVTRWPDLTMSFLIQLWRDATETGDPSFLDGMRTHVMRGIDFLCAADADGDGIPEGGSSWDVEHYPGCFIATASLTVATCRVILAIARHWKDAELDGRATAWLGRAQATLDGMWQGEWFRKYHDPSSGNGSDDCFVGQLQGEWVVRQLGLHPTVAPQRAVQALASMYRLNADSDRYLLAPIQVQSDGRLPARKYAWHAWPQYTQVFLDTTAVYLGQSEPALANLRQFDRVACELIGSPTATTLWHDARTGLPDFTFWFPDHYMNGPSIWWMLSALSGCTDNALERRLTLGPVLLPGRAESRWPVVTPRFWGRVWRLDLDGKTRVRLEIDRLWSGVALDWSVLRWRGSVQSATLAGMSLACSPAEGVYTDIALPNRSLKAGDCLQLEIAHPWTSSGCAMDWWNPGAR